MGSDDRPPDNLPETLPEEVPVSPRTRSGAPRSRCDICSGVGYASDMEPFHSSDGLLWRAHRPCLAASFSL